MHQVVTNARATDPFLHSERSVRTVVTRNADELARNLTDWEQTYDQMTSGNFQGLLTEWRTPGLQIFREEISQAVRQSCTVWDGALWFGFPDCEHVVSGDAAFTDGTRINGRPMEQGCVMVRPGGSMFELLTPSRHAIYGMVVGRSTLERAAQLGGFDIDVDRLGGAELLRVDTAARARCMDVIGAALSALCVGDTVAPRHYEDALLSALLTLLDCSEVEPAAARSFQRRQRVVARVHELILAQRDQAVTVAELCAQAHVSRRTLQYCFEDVLGMSPNTYLRRVRLNGARRQLLDPQARHQPIGMVAADWGFGSFSQFSSDYRSLFGECPSASRLAN